MMTIWTSKQLGLALKLTPQRIGQLVKADVLPRPLQGKHDPFVSIPRYLDFLQQQLTPQSLTEAKIAKLQIDTALKQLLLKERAGELVNKFRWNDLMWRCHRAIRDQFQNVGIRTAGPVMGQTDAAQAATLIDTEINQILHDAAKEVERLTGEHETEEAHDHDTYSAQGKTAQATHPHGPAGSATSGAR